MCTKKKRIAPKGSRPVAHIAQCVSLRVGADEPAHAIRGTSSLYPGGGTSGANLYRIGEALSHHTAQPGLGRSEGGKLIAGILGSLLVRALPATKRTRRGATVRIKVVRRFILVDSLRRERLSGTARKHLGYTPTAPLTGSSLPDVHIETCPSVFWKA